ncbi:MAG: hypothetical protein BRD28_00205 [Bacteroidetes bacterium QH_10_64_37]|jgi:hypothetical protein|nr:MAG: hypothetical protein BRD28_00205 [Bacteroidetes bacterium QH_10_64_37]
MTQSISAAIHIQGPTIRYAEIERENEALTLRRLGRELLGFDVMSVLWGEERDADALDRVGAVVREVLEDTEGASVKLVVHPLDVYSFFMPIPTGLSEQAQDRRVAYQAALVTDSRSSEALHTTSHSVRTVEEDGETIEWIDVLAVPQAVEERMGTLAASVPGQDPVRMISSKAAARVMRRHAGSEHAPSEESEGAYRLAVGQYPTHTEYAVTHDGKWHHAHAAQEARTPENRVYYAVGFLNRIGVSPSEIGALFLYGSDAGPGADGPFETVFDCRPAPLDPFEELHLTEDTSREEAPAPYVPCIGGALAAQPA